MKKFFNEFKEFAVKGNMIEMAVGIIIGGTFTTIVKSLVDNIFQSEKPFIIFDDLFALLDEDNLTVAKTLLHNLAKEKQIIYFTCHESRKV